MATVIDRRAEYRDECVKRDGRWLFQSRSLLRH
jgi:hypothetical protein